MKKRMGESGNIFFTLFGAVALVGVVGAATSTLMRGPVGTVVALNQRAKADSQMQIAMKLAMLEAQNNSNDCDPNTPVIGDGFIEPVGFAPGTVPGSLVGGGRLPSVGSTSNDPWGSPYGYCAWDHGVITGSGCSGGGPLLTGSPTGQGTVISVLSAGPDRLFGLTCVNAPAPNAPYITRGTNGADDLIVSMTYAEANEASGGLWSIKSGEPDKITTNRELDVSTGAQFSSGDVGFTNTRATFGAGATLDFAGGGLFMLPNECQSASCGSSNKGLLRRFTSASCPTEGTQEVLQICDGAGWLDIGGVGAIVAATGNDREIQWNNAGLMGASSSLIFNSSSGLTVGGDSIFSADLRVNQTLRVNNALNVTGATTLTGALDVDGAADFDSTIDVAMGATFGSWLRGSDGTSGSPTYSFSSDNDSGMFFSSSALRFSVDGTERMAVSAGGVTMTAGQTVGNFTVGGVLTTADLNVTNNITANRFISRIASTSASNPAFETEPGTGMYSAVADTLSLVAGGTPRIVIDGTISGGAPRIVVNATGDVGIGVLTPDAKLDVGGEIKVGTSSLGCGPTLHGAIRYVSGDLLQVCSSVTGIWEDIGTSGGGGGGAASYWTRISSVDRRLYYDDAFVGVGTNDPLDDFHVAGDLLVTGGYTGTPSIGVAGAGSRMFFDPESASFRGGAVTGSQWDDANIGTGSFGWGYNAQASGNSTFVIGTDVSTTVAGSGGSALGNKVIADGLRATAWSLGDATGAFPRVSGAESFGIFMGDQSGVNLAQTGTMALLGGRFLIDQTPAMSPVVSGTLSLDVEGGVGAMQYCDENGVNCFTAASVATGGVTAPGNNRELIYNSGGVLGANPSMVFSSAGNLTLGGTGAIALPTGDDTNRPVASANGMLRYNTVLGRFEGFQGGQWRDLVTGAALAAGANTQIQFNSNGSFGAVPAFTFSQGEMRVDGTDYNRGGVMRIRGAETVPANYLDATMILESTASGSLWSQTLVSNIPARNGDLVFAHYNGSTWAEPLVLADDGRIGIFSTNPRASLDINTTDAILLPVGSIGNRPMTSIDGMLRYNSQTGKFEGHQGGTWQDILTSAVAGGAASPNRGIQFNSGGSFAATGDLQYTSAGALLVSGTYTGVGTEPVSGAGTRMFFDPGKAAFRAGRVSGNQWNFTSVGNYSTAFGFNTIASGDVSIAMGSGAIASGNYSTSIGAVTTASGSYSTAMGNTTIASGNSSAAIGMNTTASGGSSFAMGWLSNATGNFSAAIGMGATAGGQASFALGQGAAARGDASVAMGFATIASGIASTAMGRQIIVGDGTAASGFGDGSMALGLIDDAVTITTRSQVRGIQSYGIFMGDQDGLVMTANNTMGLFGGQLVIDPKVPATQLSARGVIDVGAATDAIVLPSGTTVEQPVSAVNGMLRYNNQSNKFEGFQNGLWQDILTSAVSGGAASPNRGIQFNSNGSFAATGDLQYTSAGALLVSGAYTGAGTEPVSGAGTRMFFDPSKAAFRAGRVTGNQWDFTSVGNYSTAFGVNPIASGQSSTAIGTGTIASGNYSTAMGHTSIASGEYSVALGWWTTASGINSTAIGGSTASGQGSTAIGTVTTASGSNSTAMGLATIASGISSTAMGRHIVVGDGTAGSGFGDGSLALGLIDNAVTITTRSQVRGIQSMGVFMGDQDGLIMTADNTVGFFGGQLVIDPKVPATQLSARGVIDVGAATDAIVLPSGTTAEQPPSPVNGMLRYNNQIGKFEGFQNGSWQDILTAGVAGGAASPNRGIQFNSNGSFAATGDLQYTSAGALLVSGAFTGAGTEPVSGTGTRMFFDPGKAAIRAGRVTGNQWNFTSVGDYSTAFGINTIASGQGSVAMGGAATASGTNATAMGTGTIASGNYSTAMGQSTTASGENSFAMGWLSNASGQTSTAIGLLTNSSGFASTAMGNGTAARGSSSMATGLGTIASGQASTAMGRHVVVGDGTAGSGFGDGSFALGLIDDVVSITTRSQVQGIQSYGIFMGDQDGLVMTANNTMGLFGGQLVIDPKVPATQLSARGVIDVGAATDAIVLPSGTTAEQPPSPVNGMLRYNNQIGKFEGFQNGSWQDILTAGVAGGAASPDRGIQFNSGGNFAATGDLQYTSAGALLVTGTHTGVGTEPVFGAGTRMFFDPGKSAFRAGRVMGNQWNFTSVGEYSTAFGFSTIASGAMSTATGFGAIASGQYSTAVGQGTTASGQASVAMGSGSIASGNFSTAMGGVTTASGSNSLAVGDNTTASGSYSVAMGQNTTASGSNSFATGWLSTASGNYSATMGMGATAGGQASIALGQGAAARGDASVAMGLATIASGIASTAMGRSVVAGDGVAGSGLGDGSFALGLIDDGVTITTRSQVQGIQSYGIFMGDQDGLIMYASNTMGVFGGQLVIDPRVPAQQLSARGVIDVGAATDAIVLPSGSTIQQPAGVNGMLRYNSQTNKFEGFQNGSWQDILTAGVAGGAASPNRGIQFNSNGSFAATGNLQYTSTGTLLVTGTFSGGGTEPVTGAGVRMFFDPVKGAFRAGYVSAGQWNYTSVGMLSTALGLDTTAFGMGSTALGSGTTAIGNYSTAIGFGTTADFIASTAMGYGTISNSLASTAMGQSTTASGEASTAMGSRSVSNGQYSTAMGRYTMAGGIASTAMGRHVAAGNGTPGLGDGSLAIGLIDDAVTISVPSQIRGIQSMGIFMGDQDGLIMYASNTMGVFGGQLVIDPRVPAQQLSARGVIDVGAATDAIVLPSGSTAQQPTGVNGMLRYNSQTNKFEGFQANSWQDIVTGAASSSFISLTDTPSSYAGQANKFVRVNAGTTALEFTDQIVPSVSGQPAPTGTILDDLADVTVATPTAGQILTYSSGQWINAAIPVTPSVPAGTNTQLQFNSSGTFGASGDLAWNGTTFAVVGDITYTGTITDVSDMRLKNNILPLKDRGSMLGKLDQIGTYSFTMKDDKKGQVEFGVMAQEINKVFPELVKVDEGTAEKYMSVNYVGLIAPLIEASKELKAENESLKTQISTIEERMASLEGDMNGMKAHTGYGISKAQMGLGMMLGMMLMGGMAGVAIIVVNRRRRQG